MVSLLRTPLTCQKTILATLLVNIALPTYLPCSLGFIFHIPCRLGFYLPCCLNQIVNYMRRGHLKFSSLQSRASTEEL